MSASEADMSAAPAAIAIIGMSGAFPGAPDIPSLWRMLLAGDTGLRELEEAELDAAGVAPSVRRDPHFVARGGPLAGALEFDAAAFGMRPREAQLCDPQHRLALTHAWLALQDAAVDPARVGDALIACYLSASPPSWLLWQLGRGQRLDGPEAQALLLGNAGDYLATRVAHALDLRGPAISLQSACSSSLLCIHEACQALLAYRCDLALAGGVSLSFPQACGYRYQRDGILAPDGRCRPFDAEAAGTVFADGVGVVVLKRAEEALADGDPIDALILASAANNDGRRKVSYAAPSQQGQAEAIALALELAEVDEASVGMVEAHGTGTPIGDPIEVAALRSCFTSARPPGQRCALGSLKGNLGHLDIAAGVTGLIKAVLSLRAGVIPGTHGFTAPNPRLELDAGPFEVSAAARPWPTIAGPRRACVSSFGIGGTNVHAVLEALPVGTPSPRVSSGIPVALQLRAASSAQLRETAQQLRAHLIEQRPALASVAATLARRPRGAATWSWRGATLDALIEALQQIEPELGGAQEPSEPPEAPRVHLPPSCLAPTSHALQAAPQAPERRLPLARWASLVGWARVPLQSAPPARRAVTPRTLILTCAGEGRALAEHLRARGHELVELQLGDTLVRLDDERFTCPSSSDALARVLAELASQGWRPDRIIHAWLLPPVGAQELSADTLEQGLARGVFAVLAALRAALGEDRARPLELVSLARQLVDVSGEERALPDRATLLGLMRVLPTEYRRVSARVIDVGEAERTEVAQWAAVERELERGSSELVALRGHTRWERSFVPTSLPPASEPPPPGTYLILGGLGVLGLDAARFLARRGQGVHIVLIEPGATLEAGAAALDELRELGATAQLLTPPNWDREQAEAIARTLVDQHCRVIGLVQAAHASAEGLCELATPTSLAHVFAVKARWTRVLCEAFVPLEPRFVMLTSAMNPLIGSAGQLDKATSNAWLDTFAAWHQRETGVRTVAIAWGAVEPERAAAAEVSARFAALRAVHGQVFATTSEAEEVYARLLASELGPHVLVSPLPPARLVESWTRVGRLDDLVGEHEAGGVARERARLGAEGLARELASVQAELLGHAPTELDVDFWSGGGDSLAAVDFIERLRRVTGHAVRVADLVEHPSPRALARVLSRRERGAEETS